MNDFYDLTTGSRRQSRRSRNRSRLRASLVLILRSVGLQCTDIREVMPATPVARIGKERKATEQN